MRYFDVFVVLLCLPVALLLGAPAAGCIIATVVWTVQRIVAIQIERRAMAQEDARTALKLNFAGLMIRVWLICLAIVICGVAISRPDGAAAAATMLAAFTVYITVTLVSRTLDRKSVHA